ncbi:MAG: hypothetical protein LBE81_01465 [Azonexus sp.]|uniref:hypothetical protein n=1 Tax=Azonexus sp. TaxID=1872668 RepID=UPI00281E49BB|nr:hypothetical protein [Azonexus sp.]MDR0775295.1 hypothetical protein [Azonexus sp.]
MSTVLSARAEEITSDKESANYTSATVTIFGAIREIGAIRKTCNQYFPDLVERNDAAYQDWSRRYSNFTQEVEKNLNIVAWRMSGYNIGVYWANLDQMGVAFDDKVEMTQEQILNMGMSNFRIGCVNYENYLKSSKSDIAKKFLSEVEQMRSEKISDDDLRYPK